MLALRAALLPIGALASRPALMLRGGTRAAAVRMASTIPTAVEAPIALTSVVPAGSDVAPAAWSGDLLVLPFWEVDKNETLSLSASQAAVDTLEKVHQGELPFDRTIKVSLTDCLTKEQVTARMPHNLKTLRHLAVERRRAFAVLVRRL